MSNFTRYNISYGLNQPLNTEQPLPVIANRNPGTADKFPIGQEWVNTVLNTVYILTSIANNAANWVLLTTAGGPFVATSLTVTPGPTSLTGAFTLIAGTNTAHIADDAADHSTILGSNTGVSATTINSGSGPITLSPANTGTIVIGTAAQTGSISLGVSTVNQTVNIANAAAATGASVRIAAGIGTTASIVMGTTVAASAIDLVAGATGGVAISSAGNVQMGVDVATPVASPTATVVSNNRVGYATFTGFTTAAAGSQIFTVTNSIVTTASSIYVTVGNLGTNDAQMTMTRLKKGAGTFDVDTQNFGAAALNGDVSISWWVIN